MHATGRAEADDHSSSWESGSNSSRQSKGAKKRPTPYPTSHQGNRDDQKQASSAKTKSGYPLCGMCGRDHGLYHCQKFGNMTLKARMEYVQGAELCEGCLMQPHPERRCKTIPCRKCQTGKVHNTMLCPTREAKQQAAMLATASQDLAKKRAGQPKKDQ